MFNDERTNILCVEISPKSISDIYRVSEQIRRDFYYVKKNYRDNFEGIDEMIFSINQEKIKEEHLKEVLEKIGEKKDLKTKTITLRMTEVECATLKTKTKLLNQPLSRFFIEAGEQVKAPGFSEI